MGDRRSRKRILVAIFLLVGSNLQTLKADERKEMILLNEIETIVRLYLAANATPIEFLNLVSDDIDKTYEESGSLAFQPKVSALQESYLYFKKNSNGPEHLKIRVRPDADLRLKDLWARWGMSQTLIRAPSQPHPRVVFPVFKETGLPYAGRLAASFKAKGEDSDGRVVEVDVKRVPLTTTTEDLFKPTLESIKNERLKKAEK